MSHLLFVQTGVSASEKTKIWEVESVTGVVLAEIRWYAAWRKYTFFPYAGSTWDATCLEEVTNFLTRETEKRKAERNDGR